MASLKQIAGELGISHTLVSKVLSGRMGTTGVSAITRQAILDKARELDYRPNRLAVALKSGRNGAVGVFMHAMGEAGSDLAINFLHSISDGLAVNGERLVLRFFERDEEFFASFDARLRQEVDGVIVGGVSHPQIVERLKELEANNFPVVVVPSGGVELGLRGSVLVDYEAQCYLTTKHLLESGCRRIAHFRTLEVRYKGYVRAHAEAGVPIDERLFFVDPHFSTSAGEQGAAHLLATGLPFDGLVACSDTQAAGAIRTFLARGLRVPQDVKVTGVDNSPMAANCVVPVTSSTSEMASCGRVAVQMLLTRLEGKPVEPTIVKPELVVRESSR